MQNNEQPCHQHRTNVVEDVKEWRLPLFFPQHKENRLDELENPQPEEKPRTDENFIPCGIAKKLKTFAFVNILEGESQLISSCYVNTTHNNLVNIVRAEKLGDVNCVSLMHELRASFQHKPEIHWKLTRLVVTEATENVKTPTCKDDHKRRKWSPSDRFIADVNWKT